MQITIHVGGRGWVVDENLLLNWLAQNAVQPVHQQRVVREIINNEDTGRVLLNEQMQKTILGDHYSL
jgi:hypothetical protein